MLFKFYFGGVMGSQVEYKYIGDDDAITVWQRNFTSRIGDGKGDPEEEFLNCVRLVSQIKSKANWLEIGCGLGRMLNVLWNEKNKVIGLEPDRERFESCQKRFIDRDNVRVLNITSSKYKQDNPGAVFDCILNSMVIQHVSTTVCDEILSDIYSLLSDDGVAIISTTQNVKDIFTFQDSPDFKTQAEFNEYANNSHSQDFGIPVRKFTKKSFLESLSRNNLEVLHWGQFSYIRPEKLGWFSKMYDVPEEDIRDVGDSQYAVVRKSFI